MAAKKETNEKEKVPMPSKEKKTVVKSKRSIYSKPGFMEVRTGKYVRLPSPPKVP